MEDKLNQPQPGIPAEQPRAEESVSTDITNFLVSNSQVPPVEQALVEQPPARKWGAFDDPVKAADAYASLLPDYTRQGQERSRLEMENQLLKQQFQGGQSFQQPQAIQQPPDMYTDPVGFRIHLETQANQSARQAAREELFALANQATTIQNQNEFYQRVPGGDLNQVKAFMQANGISETAPNAYVNAHRWMTMPNALNQAAQNVATQQIQGLNQSNTSAAPVRGGGMTANATTFDLGKISERVSQPDGMTWLAEMDKKYPGFEKGYWGKIFEIKERQNLSVR